MNQPTSTPYISHVLYSAPLGFSLQENGVLNTCSHASRHTDTTTHVSHMTFTLQHVSHMTVTPQCVSHMTVKYPSSHFLGCTLYGGTVNPGRTGSQ